MINQLQSIDTWFESSGEVGEDVFFVRGRRNLRPVMETGKFGTRMDVVWEYVSPDLSGLPSEDTQRVMSEVEDSLLKTIELDYQSVLAGVFTGSGHREWYFYTQDKDEFMLRFNAALKSQGNIPLEIFHSSDPEWIEYKDMLEAFSIEF